MRSPAHGCANLSLAFAEFLLARFTLSHSPTLYSIFLKDTQLGNNGGCQRSRLEENVEGKTSFAEYRKLLAGLLT